MGFDFVLSGTASAAAIEQMIKAAVERQTNRTVKKITFKLKEVPSFNSHDTVFDGCDIEFEDRSNDYSGGGYR